MKPVYRPPVFTEKSFTDEIPIEDGITLNIFTSIGTHSIRHIVYVRTKISKIVYEPQYEFKQLELFGMKVKAMVQVGVKRENIVVKEDTTILDMELNNDKESLGSRPNLQKSVV